MGRRRNLRQPRRARLGRHEHQRSFARFRDGGETGRGTGLDSLRPPLRGPARDRRGSGLPGGEHVHNRRLPPRGRGSGDRQVLMRVLLYGEDGPLERALAARGLELVREVPDAEALVTLAPPVELRPLAELGPEGWRSTFRSWAEEPFFAVQPWLRIASARGSGSWVAVTSVVATQPFPGGASGAAALALQTLVRIAALEGVRANAVASGWRSDRLPAGLDPVLAAADTPDGRLTTPADVAAAVEWLLSADAAHVNGEVLRVDGGYTITRGSRPDPRRS